MSAADLLLVFVRSGAVLAAAGLVMLLARSNPALRVAAARFGLLGALVLSLATPWLGERARPVVAVPAALPPVVFTVAPRAVRVRLGNPSQSGAPVPMPPTLPPSSPRPVELPLDPIALMPLAWAGGSLLLLAQLLVGFAALAWARRGCRPVSPELTARVAALAAEAGFPGPMVVEGAGIAGPCVAGVMRASVLLPLGWAERTDPEVVDAVLRHELSHLANGDLRWGLLARIARILLWPQPLVWLLRGPTAAAEEQACDRQVLASGIPQSRYAAGLLELRERRGARTPSLAIGAVSRRSDFGRRIEAILEFRGRGGAKLSRSGALAVRVGAFGLALGAAFAFARPRSVAQLPDPTAGWIKAPYVGTVRLVGPQGEPVTPARAWLVLRSGGASVFLAIKEMGKGAVDVPIVHHFESTDGMLVVQAPGYGLSATTLWPVPRRLETVHLPRPVAITGRVLLPSGVPAVGQRIGLRSLFTVTEEGVPSTLADAPPLSGPWVSAVTNDQGVFQLGGLPPKANVRFDALNSDNALLPPDGQATTGRSGTLQIGTVRLRPVGRITGRVTRDGKPVAGVKIGAQANTARGSWNGNEWGGAVTDADGRYAIERLGATVYNVAPDLQNGLDRDVTARAREAVDVKEGGRVDGVDFELVPGALIEGTVTLPGGKPLSNTEIGVYGPAHPESSAWVQMTKSDTGGHYRLRVPAGAQRVYLMDMRYEMAHERLTVGDGETRTLDLHVTGIKPEEAVKPRPENPEPAKPQAPVEDAPTGSTASFGPEKPFYGPVKLPNGATARLAFLQDGSKGNPIWSPNGDPATAADRARALDMAGFGSGRPEEKFRRLFLRVDVTGPARGDYYAVVAVPHPSNWTVWQTYGDAHNRSMDLAAFRANKALKVTDMRFGVAAGPYRPVKGEHLVVTRVQDGKADPPATLSDEVSTTVAVRFPKRLEGQDVRLAAWTRGGRKLNLGSWQNDTQMDPKTGERTRTYGFARARAAEIGRIELQARPYAWATFKGIHLYPNGS